MISEATADIVIIGGGIIGCAIAYYLSRLPAGRVFLIERHSLASANTSRAAALLTHARNQSALMPFVSETYHAIRLLEAELGESLDLRVVGSLHVASSHHAQADLSALVTQAHCAHIKADWLTTRGAMRMVPWLKLNPNASVAFMPEDGFIDPYILANAFARVAKSRNVTVWEETAVREILRLGDQVTGVMTYRGLVASPMVIDAAGAWAGNLAAQIGIALPMAPVRSHYWITAPDPSFKCDQPIVILPDAKAYTRPEANGLLIGLREAQSISVDPRRLPDDVTALHFDSDPDGWESFREGTVALQKFFPTAGQIPIAHYVAGLSTYTPDGMFVLGGLPGVRGFLAATGCCGAGVAAAGGIGLTLAELATGQSTPFNLEPFHTNRFGKIDPLSESFRARCANARSHKTSG